MSVKQVSVRLLMLALVGSGLAGVALPGDAQEKRAEKSDAFSVLSAQLQDSTQNSNLKPQTSIAQISHLRDRDRSAKTVKDWLAQMEAAQVQVTSVKLEHTEAGLDIVLETAEGKPLRRCIMKG